jgi:hypothetical protein
MNSINLNLSIDEANLVLESLGEMPYRRVYELVVKIQQQASEQLKAPQAKKEQQNLAAVPDGDLAEAAQ